MSHKPSLIESVFILGCLAIFGIWLPWGLWTRAETASHEKQHQTRLAWEKEHMIQLPGQAPVEFRWGRIQWIRPAVLMRTSYWSESAALLLYDGKQSWQEMALRLDTPKDAARRRKTKSESHYLSIANGTRMKVGTATPAIPSFPYSREGLIAEGPHAGRAVFFDERLIRYEDAK